MKRFLILLVVLGLAQGAPCRERLAGKTEKLKGPVETVRTKTSQFTMQDGKWVRLGDPFEAVCVVSSLPEETEASQAEESSGDVTPDPLKELQSQGYNAGYGTSHAGYGFYKVDKRGNIVEAVHYGSDGNLIARDYYSYDLAENEIEKASFASDGVLVDRDISIYDARGNRIEKAQYLPDGTRRRKWTWAYDSWDNVTEECFIDSESPRYTITYTYKYDRLGNWIARQKQIETFEDGKAHSHTMEVAERVVTYR